MSYRLGLEQKATEKILSTKIPELYKIHYMLLTSLNIQQNTYKIHTIHVILVCLHTIKYVLISIYSLCWQSDFKTFLNYLQNIL